MTRLALTAALALSACSTPAATTSTATKATAATAEPSPPANTRYRRGDYVVYRISGEGLAPVTLREEIERQRGDVLTIHVTTTKGEGEGALVREWDQTVTDTPENQRAEKIDELVEIKRGDDGALTRETLANTDNRDAYRLYAWTLPPSTLPPAENVTREPEVVSILGTQYTCMSERGSFGAMPYTFATCADFLWTNGPAVIRASAAADAPVVWEREVVEVGRR